MALKDDDEDEGNVKKYIGRTVKKFFNGHGNFIGEVVSYNRARKFFKVKYADGDREELDLSELKEIIVDVEMEGITETSIPKATGGQKRKRDQPVKYRKGVVENGRGVKSSESSLNADVSIAVEKLLPEQPCQNSQPVENAVVDVVGCSVSGVCEQVAPAESDQPQVEALISANGFLDEKVDNHVDGRGKKRTVEYSTPVIENARPARMKKRARDASSSGSAGRLKILQGQSGHQRLEFEAGASPVASGEGKGVLEAVLDTSSSGPLPAITPQSGFAEQVSQPDCNPISASTFPVTNIAASPKQLLCNGVGYMTSGGPFWAPTSIAEPIGSPGPKVLLEKQVETFARDVYSLRAIRAISRSLPVQRQMATYAAGEESEPTLREVAILDEDPECEVVPLKCPLPPSSTCLGDLEHCVADLFLAYSFLRSLSHALFLSPFVLEEFVVALTSEAVSPMVDCVHVSLLQALRRHLERIAKNGNNSAIFCLRLSDWSLLDNITWPSYLMAYALTQGFLVGRGWSFRVGLVTKDYYKLPVDKKLAFLNFLCDKALETDEVRTEITRRAASENDSELVDTKSGTRRLDRSRGDVISLEVEFDEEFERMTRQKKESVIQKTGMEGLPQGKSSQAGEVKQLERGEDGNLDECILCGMDGVLICCDGCPAAYHSRCVGITKQGLPPGDWFCPECRATKLDSKGVRIPKGVRGGELLFVGPDGQRFFANCGYLLVSEPSLETDSVYRYYSSRDIPKFLKYLEDAGPRYAVLQAAVQGLCQPDLDSTPTANQTVPAAQKSGSVPGGEEKVDATIVAHSVGESKVISGISHLSGLVVANGKWDTTVGPEPPCELRVEDKDQKVRRSKGEEKMEPAIVAHSVGDPKVMSGISHASGLAVANVKWDTTVGPEPPGELRVEDKDQVRKSEGEETMDPAIVAHSVGDPKVIRAISHSSGLVVGNVKRETTVGPEPPGELRVEDKDQKESLTSQGEAAVVAAEQSVTPAVGPSTVFSKEEEIDVSVDTRATVAGRGCALKGAELSSPQLRNENCSQPQNTNTPVVADLADNNVATCSGWTEHNSQQKDEPVDPGKPTPTAQHMNGKCFPRQLDYNFSSLTQINACAYVNKYTNGDIVYTAAAYLATMAANSDDTVDDKGGIPKKTKPPSAADQLKAFSQAAPTFFWPSLKKRAMDAPKEKCGWCINCRTPNRKGCLLTQVTGQISGGAAGVPGGIKPVKGAGGHYAAVAAYILFMEEHLHGLLDGPWETAGHRKLWRKRVEQGRSIEDVRRALLEMESSLRKIALTSEWEKVVEDAPPLVSDYVISLAGAGGPGSKKVVARKRGRPPAVSKNPAVFAYDGACFGVKWWRGGQISRQVYNWESLPRKTLRKAARQGGLKEIRDLVYAKASDLPRRTLQCAWRARTEKVSAVAQLAVQVRCLDRCIKWSEMTTPFEDAANHNGKASNDHRMGKAEIVSKSEERGVVKYLLHFPKDVAENNDATHQQRDLSTKTMISSNGNCAGKKVASTGTKGGEIDQWSLDKDVPLWLVKDYEHRRHKTEQMKLHKSLRGRKGQTFAVEKEPSFWEKITDPDRHKPEESPLSLICGSCSLSCIKSQSLQCQRCTENFHISCTEGEETIDDRDKVAVCKSCAKLRLGQRNRKPSYKMRCMQPHYAESSFAGSTKGTLVGDTDEVGTKCGLTPKSSSKKSGNRKNGLLGSESAQSEEKSFEKKDHTRLSADSNHLQANESVKLGGSKPGKKLKSLLAVGMESRTSPDMIATERRTSSRIKNSMSPGKCPLPDDQHQPLKVKLKLGKKEVSHTSAGSDKEEENRVSSKRKMSLCKDGADTSDDDVEFAHAERKKSPQKQRRLKVLLQGLPITSEDTDNHHVSRRNDKKKTSNGLQYVRRKTKSDEDVARFREERLVFAGQVAINPTKMRCSLCSEGYDPSYSFISCEWCKEWYHGDAVGLTREDASVLMGFKCHKCRKVRAPSCPVSGTKQRRPVARFRKRGGVDYGEVIDAENVNKPLQPNWRYPLEKDLIGFNDTTDFVAATNQAEQALAGDGSNFGHGLTGSVFELGSGLMSDLEQQLHLTTPLSSLGEHNVNLWANNSGSGQLDMPSDFSPPLDLSGRGTGSLSFTELLASEDDYLEGVVGPGLPLVASWVGDAVVSGSGAGGSGSGASSSAAWCGGDGVAEGLVGDSDWNGGSVLARTTGLCPSAGWSGGETSTQSAGVGPSVGWTEAEGLSVSDGVGTAAGWPGGKGSTLMGVEAGWAGRMDNLASILTPSGPTSDGSPLTTVDLASDPTSCLGDLQAEPGSDEGLEGKDKEV